MLSIHSTQEADSETDISDLNTTAFFKKKSDHFEIAYRELDESGDTVGETVITVLSEHLVTIHKTGFAEAVMVLEPGRTHPVRYKTMLGSMEMMLCTTLIAADLTEKGGTLRLRYMLDVGETYSAVNTIDLNVSLLDTNRSGGKTTRI